MYTMRRVYGLFMCVSYTSYLIKSIRIRIWHKYQFFHNEFYLFRAHSDACEEVGE